MRTVRSHMQRAYKQAFIVEALAQKTSSNRYFSLDIKVQVEFDRRFGVRLATGPGSTAPSTSKGIIASVEAEVQSGHILSYVILSALASFADLTSLLSEAPCFGPSSTAVFFFFLRPCRILSI